MTTIKKSKAVCTSLKVGVISLVKRSPFEKYCIQNFGTNPSMNTNVLPIGRFFLCACQQ